VREFYRKNTRIRRWPSSRPKKAEYLNLDRERMTVWEMLAHLNDIVDESDPDTSFTQTDHALQTAEAARQANQPRWMIATPHPRSGQGPVQYGEPQ
jgi:inositol oxygenase